MFTNKVELIKTFGKNIVDSLMNCEDLNRAIAIIHKITEMLIGLFTERNNGTKVDPGDFLHIMENCPSELDEFLKNIQMKLTEYSSQNNTVNELLIEIDLKDDSIKTKNKAISMYKSRDHKQEHLKNLFYQNKILDEIVNDPDEKLLCLLDENKTKKIDDSMEVGIHYLPLICLAEKENEEDSSGFENVLKGIFPDDTSQTTPPHKIISVLEILSQPEIVECVRFDEKIKESLVNGLKFIDDIPNLRENIQQSQAVREFPIQK